MDQPRWNFEQQPYAAGSDETDVNLRAYFDRMADGKMREYQREWSDEEVIAWDGNFRSDGCLMLICCERDVTVGEYRRVLEAAIEYRRGVTSS
jgi:hypothetical protein